MSSLTNSEKASKLASQIYIGGKEEIYKVYLADLYDNFVPSDVKSVCKQLLEHNPPKCNNVNMIVASESNLGLQAVKKYLGSSGDFSEIKVFEKKDEEKWIQFEQCRRAVWLFNIEDIPLAKFNKVSLLIFLEAPESEETMKKVQQHFVHVGMDRELIVSITSVNVKEEGHRYTFQNSEK
jgi:hypothetical protein